MSWFTKGWIGSLVLGCLIVHAGEWRFDAQTKASLQSQVTRAGGIHVSFVLPELKSIPAQDGFETLEAPGLERLLDSGKPDLFSTGALIFVPSGFEPTLVINHTEQEEISNILIAPFQQKYRCGQCEVGFQFNASLYASNASYPSNVIQLEEVGSFQGMRLVRIAVRPVQVMPSAYRMIVTHHIDADVKLQSTGETTRVNVTPAAFELIQNTVLNGDTLSQFVRVDSTERMVIVVADAFKEAIQPFIRWKSEKGIAVTVVTYTEAGGSKENVKTKLTQMYQASKFSYVLFVGNKTSLPPFMESTSSGSAASDYRFSLLSGNSDQDIPDVFYGRMLANNTEDLEHQVRRAIDYEKNPETSASWYSSGATIASNEGSNPSDREYAEQIREGLKKGTYKDFDVFLQKEGNATANNILKSLSTGKSWLSYIGHGSGTSWGSTNDTFSNSEVTQVDNAGRLPVIIDVACLNASWVNLTKPFGKVWVTHSVSGKEAGAVAYYGGSVSISWHPPAVMAVGIATNHFEKHISTIGGSVLSGQLYLFEKMGKKKETLENLKWYNLFGDPSLYVRTAIPKHYDVYQALKDRSVRISLKDSSGESVKDATVAISADGELEAAGRTDANGSVLLDLPNAYDRKDRLVTTTGYNLETVQQKLVF